MARWNSLVSNLNLMNKKYAPKNNSKTTMQISEDGFATTLHVGKNYILMCFV